MGDPKKRTAAKIVGSQKFGFDSPKSGAIAQLGERIVRNDEVVGSSPTSSTMFKHLQTLREPILSN